jgi:hypothetical protein
MEAEEKLKLGRSYGCLLRKEATPPWGSIETDLQGPTRGGVDANMGEIGRMALPMAVGRSTHRIVNNVIVRIGMNISRLRQIRNEICGCGGVTPTNVVDSKHQLLSMTRSGMTRTYPYQSLHLT